MWEMLWQEGQQRAAQQGQVGQEIGVAAARAILSQQGVTPPMVAVFHASPVTANEVEPLLGAAVIGQEAGKIIVGFGAELAGLFDQALIAQHDQASGEGKIGR
jgi:hypothetical protein